MDSITTKEKLLEALNNVIQNQTTIYGMSEDDNFEYYKKVYILTKGNPEPKETYIDVCLYWQIKDKVSKQNDKRYIPELNGYVFWSMKDYLLNMLYANENRLF